MIQKDSFVQLQTDSGDRKDYPSMKKTQDRYLKLNITSKLICLPDNSSCTLEVTHIASPIDVLGMGVMTSLQVYYGNLPPF